MSRLRVLTALVVVLLLIGCGKTANEPAQDNTPAPSVPPVASAEPGRPASPEPPEPPAQTQPVDDASGPEGLHGPAVRSGIPQVDAAIEAAVTQDVEALGGLLTMSRVTCTTQVYGMAGLPVCPDEVSDGTPIEVFPVASCNLSYRETLEQAQQVVTRTFSRPLFVYAVYQLDGQDEVSSKFAISLAESIDDERAPVLYLDGNGAIVKVHTGCGSKPGTVLSDEGAAFVIAPRR